MSLQTIDQPLAVKLIQQWLAKQTNQPLLFYGPVGAGKRALALEAAKALNCAQGSCDACLSCKKIDTGKHPDVRVIDLAHQAVVRGEPLEKQQFLRIETVLEERRRLYQTAHEGAWKVSVVDEAHRMTADAANVLLKVLEEPPPRTTIFLLTPYRDRIFSTLLSRCQQIRFQTANSGRGTRNSGEGVLNKVNLLPHPASRVPRPRDFTRADTETQLSELLSLAAGKMRSHPNHQNITEIELIMQAQQQLRQNVPPALVYDHLLLQLSASSKS